MDLSLEAMLEDKCLRSDHHQCLPYHLGFRLHRHLEIGNGVTIDKVAKSTCSRCNLTNSYLEDLEMEGASQNLGSVVGEVAVEEVRAGAKGRTNEKT